MLGDLSQGGCMFPDEDRVVFFEPRNGVGQGSDPFTDRQCFVKKPDIGFRVCDSRGFSMTVDITGLEKAVSVQGLVAARAQPHAFGHDGLARTG